LHLLGGLDTPEAGSVILDGVDLYKISEAKRALARNEKIGFVFQFYHLLPEFTALENVLLPALMKRATSDERRATDKRARDLLKLVGLGERVSHRPAELSGGESQRVAIARALINEPVVLLCDEPTGNLDSKTAKDVMGLLLNLNRERGVSLIIATHDESLKGMAEAVLRIRDGKAID
jgi:lipoprotein-releasing system ATP-binding protein